MQSNPQPASEEAQPDRLAVTGLDCLFEETIVDEPDSGLTLAQAVHYYGMPAKEVKAKVKTGEIPGIKLARKKWRVYPLGLPDNLSENVVETLAASDVDDVVEPFDIQESPLTVQLKSKIAELEARLESAAYRNGYLEAKLEATEGQMRLVSCQPRPVSLMQKFFGLFK